MKVTDEILKVAGKAFRDTAKLGSYDRSIKVMLEAVFSLIEKEMEDNDYWRKKYNEQFLEKNELKKFIAINCFNWKPYKSGLNAQQEIYAPCQDAADTVEPGWSIWKLIDDMIEDKKAL